MEGSKLILLLKIFLLQLASLVAPVVTLFYRKGIWLTPDDPVSPYGCGTTPTGSDEPKMRKIYARYGKFIGDWWWLGIRNSAYGLAYKWKPAEFKELDTYKYLQFGRKEGKFLRVIKILGYKEYCLKLKWLHILYGYRLRPILGGILEGHAYRPINMDARPIFSIRAGGEDD